MKTLIALISLCGVSLLPAELVFETSKIEMVAGLEDKEVIGVFPFKVVGESIKIKSFEARCSCLGARVEPVNPDRSVKLEWKDGESGRFLGRFDVTKFLGTVAKDIVVHLEGQETPVRLTMEVTIPELIKVEPKSLNWVTGSEPEPQTFQITIEDSEPIQILSHKGNNENFPYELKTIEEGRRYEVTVSPKSVSNVGMGMIHLRTDSRHSRFARKTLFMVSKPARPGARR